MTFQSGIPGGFWETDTEVKESILRRLWGDGMLSAEIAAILSEKYKRRVTKNSVVGKARRLGLSSRATGKRPLPKLEPDGVKRTRRGTPSDQTREAALRLPDSIVNRPLHSFWQPKVCQFFAGLPSSNDEDKCGRPVIEGESWCAEHLNVVFKPNKDENESKPYRTRPSW